MKEIVLRNAISGRKKHKLVFFIDRSSIDNTVNARMAMRSSFTESAFCFTQARKAMEYLQTLDVSGNHWEIPDVIFLNGQPDFLQMFSGLSERIRSITRIVRIKDAFSPVTNSGSIDSHIIASLSKPLHKNNFDSLDKLPVAKKDWHPLRRIA